MAWVFLILAGVLEMVSVLFMKLSNGFRNFKYTLITVIMMAVDFYLLSLALKEIPIGTGYAIWTGIGAAGSVLLGMLFFKEPKSFLKITFLSFIIIGTVGLKLTSA